MNKTRIFKSDKSKKHLTGKEYQAQYPDNIFSGKIIYNFEKWEDEYKENIEYGKIAMKILDEGWDSAIVN